MLIPSLDQKSSAERHPATMGGLLSHSVVETWEISQVGLSTIIFRWRLTLHCTLSCVSSQRKSWTRGGAWLLYFAFKLSLPVGTRGHGAAPVPGDREGSRLNDVAQLRQFRSRLRCVSGHHELGILHSKSKETCATKLFLQWLCRAENRSANASIMPGVIPKRGLLTIADVHRGDSFV